MGTGEGECGQGSGPGLPLGPCISAILEDSASPLHPLSPSAWDQGNIFLAPHSPSFSSFLGSLLFSG